MCGRYYIDDESILEIEKIVRQVDQTLKIKKGLQDVYPQSSAVTLREEKQELAMSQMRWGIPGFQKQGLIINARAESALEKRMFRENILQRRCIILAKGFYEWDSNKNKVNFFRYDHRPVLMAGCYNLYQNEERFVILTTSANDSVEKVHERMPLILEESEIENWIFEQKEAALLLRKRPGLLKRKQEYEQQQLIFD